MKNTLRQVFHSPKFVAGFSIFVIILAILFVYPLINPGETPDDRDYYRMECRCSDLYTLFAAPGYPLPCQTEQTNRLRIE